MKDHQPSLTGAYSLVQGSFWMSYCTAVSFAGVFLLGTGYSNFALGLVMAIGNLLGASLGTGLSERIDRSETVTASRLMTPVLLLQGAAALVLLLHLVKDAVTVCAYVLYITFTVAVNSLNLKLYSDALHHGETINYGFARGLGSAAYVVLSMALGVAAERFSIRCVPLFALFLCAMQFVAFRLMAGKLPEGSGVKSAEEEHGVSLREFARKNRSFTVLLAGIALVFFAHGLIANFMINITRNVGGDTSDMGFINAFMAAVEIPVMMFYQRFFGKRDPASMLRIAFVLFTAKAFAVALAGSILTLTCAFLLQGPSFALQAAAIVPYVDKTIRYEDSAKAQSLAFAMTMLGSVLASVFGGLLYDLTSVGATLFVGCAICLAGSAIALFGLREKPPCTEA